MNIAELLLRITGDNKDAKRSLDEVARRLTEVAAKDAVAKVKLDGGAKVKAELDSLEKSLTVIGSRDVTANVKVKIDRNRGAISALRKELDLALAGGAGARAIGDIFSDITKIGTEVTKLGAEAGSAFAGFGSAAGQLASKIAGGLVSALVTLVSTIFLVIGAVVILTPVIVALAGVLAALIALVALAVAGFVALAIGFVGILIPALGVFIAIIVRVVGAFKALKDSQDKAKENAKELADAEAAHSQAVERAIEARQRVAEAETEALKSQRDAVLAVRSAELQLAESRLGITDAQIRLQRAKENLKDIKDQAREAGPAFEKLFNQFEDVGRLSPSQLAKAERRIGSLPGKNDNQLDTKEALQEVAHAQLGIKEAKLREEQATNSLADANERNNEFVREGIRAYEPYTQALKASAQANKAVAESAQNIRDVRTKQNEELKKYSKTELGVADALIKLFGKVKDIFEQAAKPALEGLIYLIDSISELLSDSGIQEAVEAIGEAFGYVFRQFGKLLRTREVRNIFRDLLNDSAQLVRIFGGDILKDFFLILLRITHTAAPELIELFRRFARFLGGLTHGKDAAENLAKGVRGVIRFAKLLGSIGKETGRIIIGFLRGATGQSERLGEWLKRNLKRFADFLNTEEGRTAVRDWLEDSINKVRDFANGFLDVYNAVKDVIGVVGDLIDILGKVGHFLGDNPVGNFISQHAGDGGESLQKFADGVKLLKKVKDAVSAGDYELAERLRQTGRDLGYKGFAKGGIVTGLTRAILGDVPNEREAVIPLNATVLAGIGAGIVESTKSGGSGSRSLFGKGSPGGGDRYFQFGDLILPEPPAGESFDARHTAAQLMRELERRGAAV